MSDTTRNDCLYQERKQWMAVLATASASDLAGKMEAFDSLPEFEWIRKPEMGMVMARGRADGTGSPFNLGEITVTRCTLRLKDGTPGSGYVMGRNHPHARNAALCDAMLQNSEYTDKVMTEVVTPLKEMLETSQQAQSKKTMSTKVTFYTMVRGE